MPAVLSNAKSIDTFIQPKRASNIIAVATWPFGKAAVEKAVEVMKAGGTSLDAVEKGANVIEADGSVDTVGYGGIPDNKGIVTLDAAIMDWKGNAGAVAFLQNIKHPISVARLVMEKTKHVLLVGEGALEFALANGFEEENLITPEAVKIWKQYAAKNKFKLKENHDTVGILAIDKNGNLSAGVSTSGTAYKLHGRVGDSAILGAGLYADNNVGGALATGWGEFSMRSLGSFLIVEKMREGYSPQEACEIAVKRLEKYIKDDYNSISYLALNKSGEIGAFSSNSRFSYAIATEKGSKIKKAKYLMRNSG